MPTIILLDVSLSMCRTVKTFTSKDVNSSGESTEIKQLANVGIGTLLDYFAQNCQLEYTALIVFSSLWELRHPFTRHHESIKNGIYDLELYDKSNVVNAVQGVLSLKLHEWVHSGPINIILITDGQLYRENTCNQTDDDDQRDATKDDFLDIPLSDLDREFDFPCKMQVICLSSPREPSLKYSIPFYKKLISQVDFSITDCPVISSSNNRNFKQSAIWLPESDTLDISIEAVEFMFNRIAHAHYKPYHAQLFCGHLSSMVMLSPSPSDYLLEPLENGYDDLKNELRKEDASETFVSAINRARLYKLSGEFSICGFMPLNEVTSPSVISRHLVLPIANSKFNETSKAEQILSQDPNAYNHLIQTGMIEEPDDYDDNKKSVDKVKNQENETCRFGGKGSSSNNAESLAIEQDISKQPSFSVLLHNGLKNENMVAICIAGKSDETNEDWYGMLHTHTDSKKRSGLMLSLLVPGSTPILWLSNFRNMGSAMLNADLPPTLRYKLTANRGHIKSYSSNSVLWLDPESVQADVQKIVRHAKRSPDRAPHFYKELNRIRRAAISYGFYDVLHGMAAILEREKRVIQSDQGKSLDPETLVHIDHVIESLRASLNEDSYDTNITPKL